MMCLWASYKKKNMEKLKMMCLWASYKKKIWNFFFASPDPDPTPEPDPLVRGTDPGIRIRTKILRIPNTGVPEPDS
jgi:hypothetical protein